jgi:hypothetical protein
LVVRGLGVGFLIESNSCCCSRTIASTLSSAIETALRVVRAVTTTTSSVSSTATAALSKMLPINVKMFMMYDAPSERYIRDKVMMQ